MCDLWCCDDHSHVVNGQKTPDRAVFLGRQLHSQILVFNCLSAPVFVLIHQINSPYNKL
jgi:hypothetical protein